jgi:hypothetical protein
MGIFKKLSDTVVRKFKEIVNVSNWQIESDMGWTDIKSINKTVEYEIYILEFESGRVLKCADNHIIIDENYNEVFAKDSECTIYVRRFDDIIVELVMLLRGEEEFCIVDFTGNMNEDLIRLMGNAPATTPQNNAAEQHSTRTLK